MHGIRSNAQTATVAAFGMYMVSLLISGSNGIVANGVELTSSQIVFFRMLIGAAFLVVAFFAMRRKITVMHNVRDLAFLVGGGVAMACELLFLYEAYKSAGVAMSTILLYLAPIVVMVLAPILFRERLTITKGAGFAIVVIGSLLINAVALDNGVSAQGILFGLGSAAGLASMIIFNKKVTSTPGLERALVQMVSCAVVCTLYIGATEGVVQTFVAATVAEAWPSIMLIGILAGVSNLLYFIAIGKLPVQSVAVCGYLEPLSAVLMSAFILGEHMVPLQIVGAAMVIGGALFAEAAGKKKPAARKHAPALLRRAA